MPDVSLYKEGILVSEYPMHTSISLKDIKSEYEARMAICKTPHCILIKMHGIALIIDEAKEFLMSSEVVEITKAAAILVDSESGYFESSKNIGRLMRDIDKPKYKIEVFETEKTAVEWLEKIAKKV